MCKSKAEGGVRCEYSDALSNVRRKARYDNKGGYDVQRQVRKAVEKWQEENPELVRAHLPAKQTFNVEGTGKRIPKSIRELFAVKSRNPIKGLDEDSRMATTKAMFEERNVWFESLTDDEENSVQNYAGHSFEYVNTHLRRKGYSEWAKENRFMFKREEDFVEKRVKPQIKDMDSALRKAPKNDEIKKVYRFFRVPAGVSPVDYIDRYFKTGDGFEEKGYMSTTVDPEFIMAHLHDKNKGNKNTQFVAMEILTKQGASLQSRETSSGGDIQSLEKEVLLPRGMKFQIAGTHASQRFEFAADRKDLYNRYSSLGGDYERYGKFKKGDKMNFPLIQMVDQELLN